MTRRNHHREHDERNGEEAEEELPSCAGVQIVFFSTHLAPISQPLRSNSTSNTIACLMDRFSLARLMGHSSPNVTARYYIHVTETHVAAGFGKFVEYQTRNVAEGLAAFPKASAAIQ